MLSAKADGIFCVYFSNEGMEYCRIRGGVGVELTYIFYIFSIDDLQRLSLQCKR